MLVGFLGFIGFGVAYWVDASTQWQAVTFGVGPARPWASGSPPGAST